MSKYVFPAEKTFIRPVDLRKRYGENYDPNIFKRWQQEGKIEKLRNGLYRNTADPIRGDVDRFVAAGRMYEPSYISMHSALRYYNFIPEMVYATTSITTQKTKTFHNKLGRFCYQTLKPELFWGYKTIAWHGGYFNLATPEKTLLDFAYLNPWFSDPDWLLEMRFDPEEMMMTLDMGLLVSYAKAVKSQTLIDRITALRETYTL
ncbi:hypothetical protein QWY85_20405 [Neolewinella lacunae]|uniref:Transcriptional regulator, AbiEi antitoxin, Type IV TA system n=1 Tax=Neolewinella lacunae TaxID=1517758 RepID=A0A923PQ53_9BACT|nr:hypothetical protein [Neolewinella lacunae]MBC6996816.1 hypothetical protein [Neolewinella lacunae]MDN3637044.1 hypothetical protein [Neolewinella lacunae]